MLKLYRMADGLVQYWETWDNGDGSHTVHWGELGERGESKVVKPSLRSKPESKIQMEIDGLVSEGFQPLPIESHRTLLIEYVVEGHGNSADVEKRHRLENRMNETLGWTGLGFCDGGSIGSGSMEACCYVVDFDKARRVIETDLKGTEFENYSRIYDENSTGA